jgi:hypothetical protein
VNIIGSFPGNNPEDIFEKLLDKDSTNLIKYSSRIITEQHIIAIFRKYVSNTYLIQKNVFIMFLKDRYQYEEKKDHCKFDALSSAQVYCLAKFSQGILLTNHAGIVFNIWKYLLQKGIHLPNVTEFLFLLPVGFESGLIDSPELLVESVFTFIEKHVQNISFLIDSSIIFSFLIFSTVCFILLFELNLSNYFTIK